MKKKACKKCKIFVDGNECPVCKGTQFAQSWQGRINIIDLEKSDIAKNIGYKKDGEYALKVR